MAGWGMPEVAAALTEAAPVAAPASLPTAEVAATIKDPQQHGWVAKSEYDYSTYMKSGKELVAEAAAQEGVEAGVEVGGWASNAAIYEWNEEYGDVGPNHPELEKQLFGSENHVRVGIKFEK